jgi:hypothetical protein
MSCLKDSQATNTSSLLENRIPNNPTQKFMTKFFNPELTIHPSKDFNVPKNCNVNMLWFQCIEQYQLIEHGRIREFRILNSLGILEFQEFQID